VRDGRIGESELVQDLRVLAVVEDGDDLLVSVYGGVVKACGLVRFTFGDADERRTQRARLDRWRTEERPVTLLATGDSVRLFCERTALARALG
jgi:hypothetical protein